MSTRREPDDIPQLEEPLNIMYNNIGAKKAGYAGTLLFLGHCVMHDGIRTYKRKNYFIYL